MAKILLPNRPENLPIPGFTEVKPGSIITSKSGNEFKISSGGGTFINKKGINALYDRENDWKHYADKVDTTKNEYNKHIEERNKKIESPEESKPWYKKLL